MATGAITSDSPARRIGFWCVRRDWHGTLRSIAPDSDEGRFVRRLIALLPEVERTLWVLPADAAEWRDAVGPGVRFYPETTEWFARPDQQVSFVERAARAFHAWTEPLAAWPGAFAPESAPACFGARVARALARRIGPRPLKAFASAPLACVAWTTRIAAALASLLLVALCVPTVGAGRLAKRLADAIERRRPRPLPAPPPVGLVDVWIAPDATVADVGNSPYVLWASNLEWLRRSQAWPPEEVARIDAGFREAGRDALFVAGPAHVTLDALAQRYGMVGDTLRRLPPPCDADAAPGPQAPPLDGLRYFACLTGPAVGATLEVVRGFAKLRENPAFADLHLVLEGESPNLHDNRDLLGVVHLHGLWQNVRLTGPLGPGARRTVLANAVAVVVPALDDVPSEGVAEALDVGRPVAAADLPAFRESAPRGQFFDPHRPESIADALARVVDAPVETRPLPTRDDVAQAWRTFLAEAAHLPRHGWEGRVPASPEEPPRLALVLPVAIRGGTWESAREIVDGLVRVNRRRRALQLTFLSHPDQVDLDADLAIDRVRAELVPARPLELGRIRADLDRPGDWAFFAGAARERLLAEDAYFFLTATCDAGVFAPVRPYGMLTLDLVYLEVPHLFPAGTVEHANRTHRPTLANADLVLCTSEPTRALTARLVPGVADRVDVVPLCCETFRRLDRATPKPVAGIERPFVFNLANFSPHKGVDVAVAGHAVLKARLGDACPALVVAGIWTEAFREARHVVGSVPEHNAKVKAIVAQSGLVVGRDVHFLGSISEAEMAWLYRECQAVVNAAWSDNGTYCQIESRWFGKPIVTSAYPAALWLNERFRIPAETFAPGDADGLADALERALATPPLANAALADVRAGLESPEYSRERFVERLYDRLVALAQLGRERRTGPSLRRAG